MVLEKIKDFIDDISSWITVRKEMLQRMIFWGWHMRRSWDFDASTIYHILHLKLDRIYKCMVNNGHLMWNSNVDDPRMRRLNEARMLAKRLSEEEMYEMRAFEEADERFEHYHGFTPMSKGVSRFVSGYKKHPKRAKMFYRGRAKIYQKQREHERKRLYKLLEKHLEGWWD